MPRFFKKVSKKAGLAPGSLIHISEKKVEKAKITIMDYDEKDLSEKEVKSVEECFPYKETPSITWINVDGLHDIKLIEKIGEHFIPGQGQERGKRNSDLSDAEEEIGVIFGKDPPGYEKTAQSDARDEGRQHEGKGVG